MLSSSTCDSPSRYSIELTEVIRSSLAEGANLLQQSYQFKQTPTEHDISTIKEICLAVSERAATYLAITLFTLWRLQRNFLVPGQTDIEPSAEPATPVVIAYCGAVLEKHPTIRSRCQEVLNLLTEAEVGQVIRRRLVLEPADDSGLLGAIVGALMNGGNESLVPTAKL